MSETKPIQWTDCSSFFFAEDPMCWNSETKPIQWSQWTNCINDKMMVAAVSPLLMITF